MARECFLLININVKHSSHYQIKLKLFFPLFLSVSFNDFQSITKLNIFLNSIIQAKETQKSQSKLKVN